ncbi:MAG: hypothetical protein V1685_05265, partial [Parcubacteria group bacterium]
MKLLVGILGVAVGVAYLGEYGLNIPIMAFGTSAVALVILSMIIGEATEQLSAYIGQRMAGLVNVTLSNLAELIIIYTAISANEIELAKAGIAGSIVGNLLLVKGSSIIVGCLRHGTLNFDSNVATLYINQLFLVGSILFLPTMFSTSIPVRLHGSLSGCLAAMLFGAYVFYIFISRRDERYQPVHEQSKSVMRHWHPAVSVAVLVGSTAVAFHMSHIMVTHVEHFAQTTGFSKSFIGFMLLPIIGNLAEHLPAVRWARRKMVELSLSISVGSASQVGMVVAPCAVFFGFLTG